MLSVWFATLERLSQRRCSEVGRDIDATLPKEEEVKYFYRAVELRRTVTKLRTEAMLKLAAHWKTRYRRAGALQPLWCEEALAPPAPRPEPVLPLDR